MRASVPTGTPEPTSNPSRGPEFEGDRPRTPAMLPNSERIRAACTAAGLTLEELAERAAEQSREYVTDHAAMAWPELVDRMAAVLGCEHPDLLAPAGHWTADGDGIRRERERFGWTAEYLARRAGVDVDVVHAIEDEPADVTVGQLVAVLHAMGVEDRKPGARTVTIAGMRFRASLDPSERWEPHTRHERNGNGSIAVRVTYPDGAAMRVQRHAAGLTPTEVAERLPPTRSGRRAGPEHVVVAEAGGARAWFAEVLGVGVAVGLDGGDVYEAFTAAVTLVYRPHDVQAARERAGLTRHGMAHALGLPWASAEWVRAIETGAAVLDRRSLTAWCEVAECSLVELTGHPAGQS